MISDSLKHLHAPTFMLACLFMISGAAIVSCKNDIETIKALTNQVNLPDLSGYNIQTEYSDSGILRFKLMAPEVEDYNQRDEPYTEFPKGLKVFLYDSDGNQASSIQANHAVYYKNTQLWEGTGNVVAENPGEGKKLESEQIFWDQKGKRIYSDKFSVITTRDGISYGENGFEAKEDLSQYRMNGYRGQINVREDLKQEEQ